MSFLDSSGYDPKNGLISNNDPLVDVDCSMIKSKCTTKRKERDNLPTNTTEDIGEKRLRLSTDEKRLRLSTEDTSDKHHIDDDNNSKSSSSSSSTSKNSSSSSTSKNSLFTTTSSLVSASSTSTLLSSTCASLSSSSILSYTVLPPSSLPTMGMLSSHHQSLTTQMQNIMNDSDKVINNVLYPPTFCETLCSAHLKEFHKSLSIIDYNLDRVEELNTTTCSGIMHLLRSICALRQRDALQLFQCYQLHLQSILTQSNQVEIALQSKLQHEIQQHAELKQRFESKSSTTTSTSSSSSSSKRGRKSYKDQKDAIEKEYHTMLAKYEELKVQHALLQSKFEEFTSLHSNCIQQEPTQASLHDDTPSSGHEPELVTATNPELVTTTKMDSLDTMIARIAAGKAPSSVVASTTSYMQLTCATSTHSSTNYVPLKDKSVLTPIEMTLSSRTLETDDKENNGDDDDDDGNDDTKQNKERLDSNKSPLPTTTDLQSQVTDLQGQNQDLKSQVEFLKKKINQILTSAEDDDTKDEQTLGCSIGLSSSSSSSSSSSLSSYRPFNSATSSSSSRRSSTGFPSFNSPAFPCFSR